VLVAAQTAAREEEFRAFVLGCQARLLRFAELVTGDRGHAEDLLQHGFAKSYAAWGRLRSASAEQYVRRCIINARSCRR
jgi:DNA-directed RNA polymerase specialized sigma24 family protein